jgi:hypothetical protein
MSILVLALILQVSVTTFLKLYLGREVYFFGGQEEIQCRRYPQVIEEQRELTFVTRVSSIYIRRERKSV